MNYILEKSAHVKFYTYLDRPFAEIRRLRQYHWLISDHVCNYYPDARLQNHPVLIDGYSLNDILQEHHIQFIWGVFSGFKKEPERLPSKLPRAYDNGDFWKGVPAPQAKGAAIEIACVDSSCTLFIGCNTYIGERLRILYPDIKDLNAANERRG